MNTPNMVPRFLVVLAEKDQPFKVMPIPGNETACVLTPEIRAEISRIESGGFGRSEFPKYVAALAVQGEPLETRCDDNLAIRGSFAEKYQLAVQKYEAASAMNFRDDEGSPIYEIYEVNKDLPSGAFWRIYTESPSI